MEKVNENRNTRQGRFSAFWEWCLHNHPGKSIGSILGFCLALAFILLGFWQTILLLLLTAGGFYLGRCWDLDRLPPWLDKLLHRIWRKGKNK